VGGTRGLWDLLARRLARRLHWEDKLRLRHDLAAFCPLDHDEHDILVHVESRREWKARACACSKEPKTVAWIEHNLVPGDVFYDIGANVGAYSLLAAAAVDGNACVYAFEPSFANFDHLCRNILLNEAQHAVTPFLVPLGERTGLDKFYFQNTDSGEADHAFGHAVTTSEGQHAGTFLEMAGFSLDDFVRLPGVQLPTLMKIDVDGLESKVLLGARQTLSHSGLRGLLIEIDDADPAESRAMLDLLQDAGLRPLEKHQLRERANNYVFVRDTAATMPRLSAADVPLVWIRPSRQGAPVPAFRWGDQRAAG
jgi:FkbM family methyltransferase